MLDLQEPVKEIHAAVDQQNAEIEKRRAEIAQQAQKALISNQECYVAQWILQNPDKRMEDYQLEFQWREDGFGYNVYMKRRDA